MKKLVLAAATTLLAASAMAGNVDTTFYADQGKVVIPSLKMGTQSYYILLRRQGTTFNFAADMSTLTLLSPPLNYTPPSASEILGTWSPADELNSSITLNANGTYSLVSGANGEPDCPNGGPESGTYQYEPANGVFLAVATSDSNGSCGLSHPDVVNRFKKIGTDIYLFFKDNGQEVSMKLIKKP